MSPLFGAKFLSGGPRNAYIRLSKSRPIEVIFAFPGDFEPKLVRAAGFGHGQTHSGRGFLGPPEKRGELLQNWAGRACATSRESRSSTL